MTKTFAERLAEDRRGAILRILGTVEGHALNEDLLTRELLRQRFGQVTRDDMRGLLAWLERQALVEIERLPGGGAALGNSGGPAAGDLWAVTASRAGRDVARGAEHPGIAQPL
ncbi:MAG: hypothetical protein K5Q68_14985 [Roseococcus sp.]|nr:hypothetical protein [Roseococcus sp.]